MYCLKINHKLRIRFMYLYMDQILADAIMWALIQ